MKTTSFHTAFTGIMLLIASAFLVAPSPAGASSPERYAVYYSNELPSLAFKDYSLVIFDGDHHPPLYPLKNKNITTLGYISLGEVESYREWYDDMKAEGLLLQENKHWPGSYYVDMRTDKWQKRVIEELIPAILARGFDGLIFDTLDNPTELEVSSPETYKGMKAGAIRLVKAIRQAFPDIPIMMNRGYGLLPEVAGDVDMIMAECLYTDYNFDEKTYFKTDTDRYNNEIAILKNAQRHNSELTVYTLDYWYPKDRTFIAHIYAHQRKQGFIPYVSTIGLDKLITEPGRDIAPIAD